MQDEVWLPIAEYANDYEVSSLGRVRSIDRIVRRRRNNQTFLCNLPGRILRPARHNGGYLSVHLSVDAVATTFLVHRLVAAAFLKRDEGDEYVNHIDGVKVNNAATNLEWCTPSENTHHAVKTGLHKAARGERTGHAKLTDDDVRQIRARIADGQLVKHIAVLYGVSTAPISYIKNGKAWLHVV